MPLSILQGTDSFENQLFSRSSRADGCRSTDELGEPEQRPSPLPLGSRSSYHSTHPPPQLPFPTPIYAPLPPPSDLVSYGGTWGQPPDSPEPQHDLLPSDILLETHHSLSADANYGQPGASRRLAYPSHRSDGSFDSPGSHGYGRPPLEYLLSSRATPPWDHYSQHDPNPSSWQAQRLPSHSLPSGGPYRHPPRPTFNYGPQQPAYHLGSHNEPPIGPTYTYPHQPSQHSYAHAGGHHMYGHSLIPHGQSVFAGPALPAFAPAHLQSPPTTIAPVQVQSSDSGQSQFVYGYGEEEMDDVDDDDHGDDHEVQNHDDVSEPEEDEGGDNEIQPSDDGHSTDGDYAMLPVEQPPSVDQVTRSEDGRWTIPPIESLLPEHKFANVATPVSTAAVPSASSERRSRPHKRSPVGHTKKGTKRKINRPPIQVKNACVNCQKLHKPCNDARPCERCVKKGPEAVATCADSTRKPRRDTKKKTPPPRKKKVKKTKTKVEKPLPDLFSQYVVERFTEVESYRSTNIGYHDPHAQTFSAQSHFHTEGSAAGPSSYQPHSPAVDSQMSSPLSSPPDPSSHAGSDEGEDDVEEDEGYSHHSALNTTVKTYNSSPSRTAARDAAAYYANLPPAISMSAAPQHYRKIGAREELLDIEDELGP